MYYGIGSECFSYGCNLGTLYRSAFNMGAQFIFSCGHKPDLRGDVPKSWRHIPYFHHNKVKDFLSVLPKSSRLVGIELSDEAHNLYNFIHPKQAVYILGNESTGLSEETKSQCDCMIYIPSKHCLNVSVAGSIVMYDRNQKQRK